MDTTLRRRALLQALTIVALGSRTAPADDCHDFDWLLARRRMVRRFRPDPVSDLTIRELIDTATRAPSAGHLQPWAFIVVRDPTMRRRLGEAAAGQVWLADAPVSIVACADPDRSRRRYGARADHYAIIDTSFACLLLLLGVTQGGLGACFVGAFDDARVRSLLAIPPGVQPLAVIPIGYPAETPKALVRRPSPSVIHSERWTR